MKVLLLGSLPALLATPALAQHHSFQVGPTVGATLATARFDEESSVNVLPANVNYSLRGGFLAGATGRYQSKSRWGGQAAVLFTQQGYRHPYRYGTYQSEDNVRLNYLRLPLQATFSQHAGGQGWQLFAGPYVGALLGGQRTSEITSSALTTTRQDRVVVTDTHHVPVEVVVATRLTLPDYTYYSRRFDVGLQGGVGYRVGNALLQVGYTLGLRNLATTTVYEWGTSTTRSAGEPYRTRGWQASLTYLLGPKF